MEQHKVSPLPFIMSGDELNMYAKLLAEAMLSIIESTGQERHTMELSCDSRNSGALGDWKLTLERIRQPDETDKGKCDEGCCHE